MNISKICSYTDALEYEELVHIYDHTQVTDKRDYSLCPYCSTLLTFRNYDNFFFLTDCQLCGWWKILALTKPKGFGHIMLPSLRGTVKNFDIASLDIPLADLRLFLKNKPHHISNINPVVFEKLMADCLKSLYEKCEVIHVGGTGDGGVDIKLVVSDNETYLVQVKRRGNLSKPEGIKVVRELNGVLFREGKAKGMVITTAKNFTKGAINEANIKTKTEEPYEIKLLNFDNIVSMLNLPMPNPYEPWSIIARRIGGLWTGLNEKMNIIEGDYNLGGYYLR